MTTPQAGIFAVGTRTHHHLEFDVGASVPLASMAAAIESMVEIGSSNVVVGFG